MFTNSKAKIILSLLIIIHSINAIQGRIFNETNIFNNTISTIDRNDNNNNKKNSHNNDIEEEESYYIMYNKTKTKKTKRKCGLKNVTNIPKRNSNCWDFTLPIFLNHINEVTYNQKGCDHSECQELVCACDPYCCATLWDLSCRGYPDNRFVPGCSAHYLCCEKKIEIPTPQKSTHNSNEDCNCYRKRIPTV